MDSVFREAIEIRPFPFELEELAYRSKKADECLIELDTLSVLAGIYFPTDLRKGYYGFSNATHQLWRKATAIEDAVKKLPDKDKQRNLLMDPTENFEQTYKGLFDDFKNSFYYPEGEYYTERRKALAIYNGALLPTLREGQPAKK